MGPAVVGLPLTKISRRARATTLIYGTCTPQPAGDEASCTPPLEIEVASIRNALLSDVRPSSRFAVRGASVLAYGDGRLELALGASNVVISARSGLARRAGAALRPLRRPHQGTLAGARYPRYYVAQLRRIYDTYAQRGDIDAVRRQLGISRSALRFELGLARELGATRLHHGHDDGPTLQQIQTGPPRRHARRRAGRTEGRPRPRRAAGSGAYERPAGAGAASRLPA